MTRFIRRRILAVLALLGLVGSPAVRADDVDPSVFVDEKSARAYLDENPSGPLAKEAFLALVEFDLARAHPGFSREEIASGFAADRGIDLFGPPGIPVIGPPGPRAGREAADDPSVY